MILISIDLLCFVYCHKSLSVLLWFYFVMGWGFVGEACTMKLKLAHLWTVQSHFKTFVCSWYIRTICLTMDSLVRTDPLVLQTEALQVLTALPRFYFPTLGSSWVKMGEVCVSLLSRAREGLQQHLLKVLLFLGWSKLIEAAKSIYIAPWVLLA